MTVGAPEIPHRAPRKEAEMDYGFAFLSAVDIHIDVVQARGRSEDAGLPRTRARRGPDTTSQRMAETRVGRDRKISFRTKFLQTEERGLHRWRSSRRYGCRGSFPSQPRARRTPSHSAYRYSGVRGAEAGRM